MSVSISKTDSGGLSGRMRVGRWPKVQRVEPGYARTLLEFDDLVPFSLFAGVAAVFAGMWAAICFLREIEEKGWDKWHVVYLVSCAGVLGVAAFWFSHSS
jgi:hypothetical protein